LSRMFERARQEIIRAPEPQCVLAPELKAEPEAQRADHEVPAPPVAGGAERAGAVAPDAETRGGSCNQQRKRLRAMRLVGDEEGDECSGSGEEEAAEESAEASEPESAWSGEERAPPLVEAFRERRALDEASRLHRQRCFEAEERTRWEVITATSVDVSSKRADVAPAMAQRGAQLLGTRREDESASLYRFGARSATRPQRSFLQARTLGQVCA